MSIDVRSLRAWACVGSLVALALCGRAEGSQGEPQSTPGTARQTVAFVISERFNIMDFAGPWEVFQDAAIPQEGATRWEDNPRVFRLYTVSESIAPVKSTGGATFIPAHTFATAPRPDIIVVGAQSLNSPALHAWLRSMHDEGAYLMSVCVGAGKLAEAGLLDGLEAATHHDYLEKYRTLYSRVKWVSGERYVRSAPRISTAGGLTSGIDLALRVVADRFGEHVAQGTAEYMEYGGAGWKPRKRPKDGRSPSR